MSRAALIAAGQTADALQALLLHLTEDSGFGDVPVVEKLAEALALSIDVQLEQMEACDHQYREAALGLQSAAAEFIQAWSG